MSIVTEINRLAIKDIKENAKILNEMVEKYYSTIYKLFEEKKEVRVWNLSECYSEIKSDYMLKEEQSVISDAFFSLYIQDIRLLSLKHATNEVKTLLKKIG